MNLAQQKIKILLQRQLDNELSEDERFELFQYMEDPILAQDIQREIEGLFVNEEGNESLPSDVSKQILDSIIGGANKSVRMFFSWYRVAIAALIIICSGIGFFFLTRQYEIERTVVKGEIQPGKEGATLTLANGKIIRLDKIGKGAIEEHENIRIYNDENGELIYEIGTNPNEGNELNILETAVGETYKVKLPDGSQICLNSGSKLTYPVSMLGKERRVKLVGEAFFDVKKNEKTFIVESKNQEVHVLGTSFNISAYNNDRFVQTTLVRGHVKVKHQNRVDLLEPGQQLTCTDTINDLKVVNTQLFTAWKDGSFSFSDEALESILKRAARWYNVQIVYTDESSKHKRFEGFVSRFSNMEKLLKVLELTGDVSFKISDRTVYVMEKKTNLSKLY